MIKLATNTQKRLRELAQHSPPSRFLDYRHFIRNLKETATRELGRYSYAQFSRDLGFSGNHVSYILTHDVRKLSSKYLGPLESALRLPVPEKKYLRALVEYTHAKDNVERQRLFEQLLSIKSGTLEDTVDKSHLRFFTNWRHAAIFELFDLDSFQEDPEWISRQFVKDLTKEDVEKSLDLLQSLDLIARGEDGRLRKTNANLTASETVSDLAKAGFHIRMMEEAKDALSTVAADQREFGAVTLSLSEEHFQRLLADLALFKRYAMQLSALSDQKSRVVQFNFQLFPFTKGDGPSKEGL